MTSALNYDIYSKTKTSMNSETNTAEETVADVLGESGSDSGPHSGIGVVEGTEQETDFKFYKMLRDGSIVNSQYLKYDKAKIEEIKTDLIEGKKCVFCFIRMNSNAVIEWLEGYKSLCEGNSSVMFYIVDVTNTWKFYFKYWFPYVPHFVMCKKTGGKIEEKAIPYKNIDGLNDAISTY